MRGEYVQVALIGGVAMELPPHARRIQYFRGVNEILGGTTSACAENTNL